MKGIKFVGEWIYTKNGKTVVEYQVEYHSGKSYNFKNKTLPTPVLDFILNKPSKTTYISNEFGPYAGTTAKYTSYR